jgi:ParB family chromosome partitioning protein
LPEPLDELVASIRAHGLRSPVEVFPLPAIMLAGEPGEPAYGLVSGLRRLKAFQMLRDEGLEGFDAIPAFLRDMTPTEAFRAMIEENDIRADISPWERGRAALLAVEHGFFETLEQAVDGLHPAASKQKRARIRALARVVEAMDDAWTTPERLSERNILTLGDALRAGFGSAMLEALAAVRGARHARQWQVIRPYLDEHLAEQASPPDPPHAPGRPRRHVRLRQTLTVRRERSPEGFVLRFSGPEATSPLLEKVVDQIERMYGSR